MASRPLLDTAWSAGHVAGANRNPIDLKRSPVRKIEAETLALADQPDDAGLPVAK